LLESARALATEALTLERTLSDLVNQACASTPAEIALIWQASRRSGELRWQLRVRVEGFPALRAH